MVGVGEFDIVVVEESVVEFDVVVCVCVVDMCVV